MQLETVAQFNTVSALSKALSELPFEHMLYQDAVRAKKEVRKLFEKSIFL